MRHLKITLAYDGTNYAGWQVQPGRSTVQGVLEAALEEITGKRSRLLAAGRTDAGVHALGQVAGLRTESRLPVEVLCRALNARLPADVAVLEVEEVSPQFHPVGDVLRKHYRYVIHDGPIRDVFQFRYCWHFRRGRLDHEAMNRAAQALRGTHDFQGFQSSGAPRKGTVRTVFRLEVRRGRAGGPQHAVVIDLEANGFLYNMARAIVGTLVEVGRGARPESWPAEVLSAADRTVAGPTAPPQGLFLVAVHYRAPEAQAAKATGLQG